MTLRQIAARAALVGWIASAAAGVAQAATLAELAEWCGEPGRPNLCSSYLETMIEGLASTDPVINGGNRMCIPPEADRNAIIRQVRAYAGRTKGAAEMSALDGVGSALKGRFPCP